jgi:hypothetical protein
VVGTSFGDEESAATLWKRGTNGATTAHDLNNLIVNSESQDLSLRSATAIDMGGPESRIVIAGWGVETGGDSPLASPTDTFPHWFLLVEEIPLAAAVDLDPDVLNPRSKGRWLTCYVELPEGYDPADIDVSTVLFNETVPAEQHPAGVGDYDGDGIPDLMVKFSRSEVIDVLPQGQEAEVRVSGEVDDAWFGGTDTVRVLFEAYDGEGIEVYNDSDEALTPYSGAGIAGVGDLPSAFALHRCSPNPFAVSTVVRFDLPEVGFVSIKVYDIKGRVATTLTERTWPPGSQSVDWDGADQGGTRVSPGIYFVRMEAGEFKATSKLLLMR